MKKEPRTNYLVRQPHTTCRYASRCSFAKSSLLVLYLIKGRKETILLTNNGQGIIIESMENNLNNEEINEEIIELFVEEESLPADAEADKSRLMDFEVETEQPEDSEQKSSTRKKRFTVLYNIVRVFALALAAGVLIYASYSLTDSYLNYKEDQKKYASINDMFLQETEEKKTDNKSSMDYSTSLTTWVWDYKSMLQYNDEAKGYIKLDGTRIQYPILEHSDNDFYLKRGSDKVSNGAGSIFIDYRTEGLEGKMCIIYGHNMLDGSMFKELMSFRNKDFCKKHPTFDVYVGYKHYIYYAFSTFSTKVTNEDIYKFGFEDDKEFQDWINRVYNKSTYKFDNGKPDVSDKIIMCSTCVDDYGNRQIVCLYRGEEVVD